MRYLEPRGSDPAALALGCMNFGGRTPKPEALRVIDRAIAEGVGLLDTANAYGEGASERIVGEAIRGRRDAVLVATKVGLGSTRRKPEGLAPARVLAGCDESRKRLGVDRIDLYYLHLPDPETPIEATLEAIATLRQAGRIDHWGVSNYASWQILELRGVAASLGLPPPAVAQQLYNAVVRQLDVEYFAFARRYPIHTTVYNPLAGGLLTGRHQLGEVPKGSRFDGNVRYQRRYWTPGLFAAVDALRVIAADVGIPLVRLAYAFALGHRGVDSVLAGPGSVAHLEDALAARSVTLPPDVRRRIDEVYVTLVGTDVHYAR